MPEAVIVSSARTAMGKGRKGSLRKARPDELAATAIREAVARAPGLDPASVQDVVLGCAMPEGEQGMNVARIASLRAGLPVSTPAVTVNRFCASGLQTIAMGVDQVQSGRADVVVTGGTESMSRVSMFPRTHANPSFADGWPDVYLGMGLTAENLAKKYGIGREESDAFSAGSHDKALRAIQEGKFENEIVPYSFEEKRPGKNSKWRSPVRTMHQNNCNWSHGHWKR
ncbi:MAG: beta-ketoacyl synthase N-terminal-like domain-containing protein [Planctomycetota bacterium]